jgi:hypothetical protein
MIRIVSSAVRIEQAGAEDALTKHGDAVEKYRHEMTEHLPEAPHVKMLPRTVWLQSYDPLVAATILTTIIENDTEAEPAVA